MGSLAVNLLIALPYDHKLEICKNKFIGYLHSFSLSEIKNVMLFGNFSKMVSLTKTTNALSILSWKDLVGSVTTNMRLHLRFLKNKYIFAKDSYDLWSAVNTWQLDIGDHSPIHSCPHCYSPAEELEIK